MQTTSLRRRGRGQVGAGGRAAAAREGGAGQRGSLAPCRVAHWLGHLALSPFQGRSGSWAGARGSVGRGDALHHAVAVVLASVQPEVRHLEVRREEALLLDHGEARLQTAGTRAGRRHALRDGEGGEVAGATPAALRPVVPDEPAGVVAGSAGARGGGLGRVASALRAADGRDRDRRGLRGRAPLAHRVERERDRGRGRGRGAHAQGRAALPADRGRSPGHHLPRAQVPRQGLGEPDRRRVHRRLRQRLRRQRPRPPRRIRALWSAAARRGRGRERGPRHLHRPFPRCVPWNRGSAVLGGCSRRHPHPLLPSPSLAWVTVLASPCLLRCTYLLAYFHSTVVPRAQG